jgi:hypothetical protein
LNVAEISSNASCARGDVRTGKRVGKKGRDGSSFAGVSKKAMIRKRASRQISAQYAGLIAARIDAGDAGGARICR